MPAARDTESAPLLPRRGDHNDGDIGDAPSSTDTGFLTRRWRKSAMKAAGILGATMVVAAIFSSSSGHVQHTMKGEQDLAAMERANVAAEVLDSAEGGTEAGERSSRIIREQSPPVTSVHIYDIIPYFEVQIIHGCTAGYVFTAALPCSFDETAGFTLFLIVKYDMLVGRCRKRGRV